MEVSHAPIIHSHRAVHKYLSCLWDRENLPEAVTTTDEVVSLADKDEVMLSVSCTWLAAICLIYTSKLRQHRVL